MGFAARIGPRRLIVVDLSIAKPACMVTSFRALRFSWHTECRCLKYAEEDDIVPDIGTAKEL